jgi:hypothetical protein
LWDATKNGLSIFFSVREGTTQILKLRYGILKNDHTRGFINFLGGLAYIAFFWTFGCLNSNLNYGYIKYTSNSSEENTWRCVNPETMHVSYLGAPSTFGTLSTHCRLVICLRCCRSLPKKTQKWQK